MCIILVGRHVRVLEEPRDVGEAGAIVAKPGDEEENEGIRDDGGWWLGRKMKARAMAATVLTANNVTYLVGKINKKLLSDLCNQTSAFTQDLN